MIKEFKQVFQKRNNAIVQLIVINVIVFFLVNFSGVLFELFYPNSGVREMISGWFSLPNHIEPLLRKPWTFLTYMFTHRGFFHIIFNMLWLYYIGSIFQEFQGAKKVISTYILGGFFGAIFYMLAMNIFPLFANFSKEYPIQGASAGVYALIIATTTLLPDYSIRMMFIGNVKLKWLALVMIGFDLLSLAGTNAGGHFAHLGGALFGYLYVIQLRKGRDLASGFNFVVDKIVTLFSPRSRMKVTKRPTQSSNYNKSATTTAASKPKISASRQEVIDKILDKISVSGYDSLTKEEKEILFKAGSN